MQILGKRSKILLIAVAIVMLVAVGVSFATWDSMSAVKASNGDLSSYANAKVGDEIEFGQYYQTGKRINNDENAEYEKTPIKWIVVDKDERTGQITLMSKYILACGSYFGNYYDDGSGYDFHYNKSIDEVAGVPYNQAYVESTARAYLNNLERLDLGGDSFDAISGYIPSGINSSFDKTKENVFTQGTGLLSSIGFSNKKYFTYLKTSAVAASFSGFFPRTDGVDELYYQRPIDNIEFQSRPATLGFYDEAFSEKEKSIIVPKVIAGYTGHRWPDGSHNMATKSYVEGAVDKVWLPSATELNVMNGIDWTNQPNDAWTSPSDEAGSTVFEYFKNLSGDELNTALQAKRTEVAKDGKLGNYSIPVYDKGTTIPKNAINANTNNTSDHYWTRSPASYWHDIARLVNNSGSFDAWITYSSRVGVRPCVILKY